MTTLEKICKIKKIELVRVLIEEKDLVVGLTTSGLLVSVDRPDEDGSNWETQIISL